MMTHQTKRARGLCNWSIGRTALGIVAGLAILGSTATAMAEHQNGRRERGVQNVQQPVQQNSHSRQGGRNDHRGPRDDHRAHDNRGHGYGHGHSIHGHHGGSIEIHIGGTISHGGYGYVSSYRPAPRPTYAQLEYQRGYADAQYAGFEAGKSDALCWRPYCDTVNVCFDRVSSHYRAGYLAAYACAYREGYQAGECERQTVRLRYSNRSVRVGSSCWY